MFPEPIPRSIRVLLIEDNIADVYLIGEALKEERLDFELEIIQNGEDAVDALEHWNDDEGRRPDIVLLDLNLPRSDGKTVLKRLQELPDGVRVPVVVITSSDSPKDREDVARLGASLYFRKPSSLAEFMKLGSVVRAFLYGRAASGLQ